MKEAVCFIPFKPLTLPSLFLHIHELIGPVKLVTNFIDEDIDAPR